MLIVFILFYYISFCSPFEVKILFLLFNVFILNVHKKKVENLYNKLYEWMQSFQNIK